MTFWNALFTNPLLIYALTAGLLASVVSGIIGSYVVVKRIVFISGSIAHSILGGIGLFIWLDRVHGITFLSPLFGALIAGVLSSLLIGWIHLFANEREDTVIAAVWSVGMAAGILFISQTPGFNVELMSFLIGNILWVTPQDLVFLLILDLFVIVTVTLLHKRFLIICYDEEQAKLQGIHVTNLYLLLLALIAISIVLLIQIVGIVLVMTLLTIPAAVSALFTNRLSMVMITAIGISALLTTGGTVLSFHLDWPTGATIALLAGATYLIAVLVPKKLAGNPPPIPTK